MTDAHAIARLHTRCRVGARGVGRARALRDALVDGQLEAALAAFAPEELVVVRRVAAPVSVADHHTDWHAARLWAEAIVAAVRATLLAGDPSQVARFRRRVDALAALLAVVAVRDATRDWAWRRLDLLPAGVSAADAAAVACAWRAILPDAGEAVALLRLLAARGALPLVASSPGADLLTEIADACLGAVAAGTLPVDVLATAAGAADAIGPEPAPRPALVAAARDFAWIETAALGDDRTRLWRLISAVVARPAGFRRPGVEAATCALREWCAALRVAAPDRQPPTRGDEVPAPDAGPSVAATPASWGRPGPAVVAGRPDDLRGAPRTGAQTAFGGLLLLAPLLEECGALAIVDDDARWSGAELDARLHLLALALVPALRPDDPAALAFAGLPPEAAPPGEAGRRPATAAQQAATGACRERLLDALAQRLPEWNRRTLLQVLVDRPATVFADPGWFEVRFRWADLSVDLRRAGLDLDPGFIPWLGVVLRFGYA